MRSGTTENLEAASTGSGPLNQLPSREAKRWCLFGEMTFGEAILISRPVVLPFCLARRYPSPEDYYLSGDHTDETYGNFKLAHTTFSERN